ncbi:hypothetical protein J1N35_034915 [Gossypium stocksii]|uniref:Uncharacterized protein n=1 Tax=Gossypium stocksii TaxID=47602 RepID=A0A9D3USY1_9ROSI|nr:hypothetical protein J1N35_034915 [Gossypium stocksii]
MQDNETLFKFYVNLCDITNHTFALCEQYSNAKLARKVLRCLHEKFAIKVIAIKEANDIDNMRICEFVGPLQTNHHPDVHASRLKNVQLNVEVKVQYLQANISNCNIELCYNGTPINIPRIVLKNLYIGENYY